MFYALEDLLRVISINLLLIMKLDNVQSNI